MFCNAPYIHCISIGLKIDADTSGSLVIDPIAKLISGFPQNTSAPPIHTSLSEDEIQGSFFSTSNSILLPSVIIHESRVTHPDDNGVYEAEDSTLRAFANESPRTPTTPRPRSQVDLVLPPAAAFTKPGT
jgi:hypothetical protein